MTELGVDLDAHLPQAGHTFTYERVERQLRRDTFVSDSASAGSHPIPFVCESLKYKHDVENNMHEYYSQAEQHARLKSLCRQLYDAVAPAEGHCKRLDDCFSQIVVCNFQTHGRHEKITEDACDILGRLPEIPLELPDQLLFYSPDDSVDVASRTLSPRAVGWRDLSVVTYVANNVIRTALMAAIFQTKTTGTMLDEFIDTTADLLSTSSELCQSTASSDEKHSWFLVRAFLWTSWQRCSMMYFYTIVGSHLKLGFNDHDGNSLILKSCLVAPGVSIQEMSRRFASAGKSEYMCGWAFELLRSHPSAIGLDFRRFHHSFSDAFGARAGRCIQSQQTSCKGDDLEKCHRFKGMKITDQSAHGENCSRHCKRLFWNETSYRSVAGARAVELVDDPSHGELTYCEASGDTLAVSHVWSHGQGGRPELGHGFNHCLHRRYIAIAQSLGCSSYWMDSPCIPEDHQLRQEAIAKINEVFEMSRATVIYDRDLTEVNVEDEDLSVRVCELILVTAMICDWNLRAWTFLEAFRGRRNIYMLCKDNRTVSLRDTVEVVFYKGSIDIALLLLTIPHLLPSRDRKDFRYINNAHESGFMTVETAGSHLSHRAASRPGDDVVIWSLLTRDKIAKTPRTSVLRRLLYQDKVYKESKAFWKRQRDRSLNTSFLLSSAPRLKTRGLRWAPSSPMAELWQNPLNGMTSRLLALDGIESEAGLITKDGHLARWLTYDLIGNVIGARTVSTWLGVELNTVDDRCQVNLRRIRQRHLRGYIWGIILQPLHFRSYMDPAPNRSHEKTLVAVCATNFRFRLPCNEDERVFWKWRGVYEWDNIEPLPHLQLTSDVLLV